MSVSEDIYFFQNITYICTTFETIRSNKHIQERNVICSLCTVGLFKVLLDSKLTSTVLAVSQNFLVSNNNKREAQLSEQISEFTKIILKEKKMIIAFIDKI